MSEVRKQKTAPKKTSGEPLREDKKNQPKEEAQDESEASDKGEADGDKGKEGEDGEGEEPKKDFHLSKKAIVIIVIVTVLVVILGVLYYLHSRQFVSTNDAYTTGRVHQVSSRVNGTVVEVSVQDNQMVKMNDVVVRLDPRDYEVSLKRSEAALLQAKAKSGQSDAKIAQAKAQQQSADAQVEQSRSMVSQSQAQLDRAQADYGRISGLHTRDLKAVSKADVDEATESLDKARAALIGARSDLAAKQADAVSDAADVLAAEADAESSRASIVSSEADVENAQLQLSYCEVRAPADGKVSKRTVETGQRLQDGQALLSVVPTEIWVLANMKETQLDRVEIGQRVDVVIDALKDETFYGTVDSIQEGSGATFALLPPDNATGNFTKIVQRVPVKIVFDAESIRDFKDKIVPGLSVTPKIDLESLKNGKREKKRQDHEQKQNREKEQGK